MKYTKLIVTLCVLAVLATFSFVLLHRPQPAQAQMPDVIYGYVYNPSGGAPWQNHTMNLLDDNNNLLASTQTNANGYYEFSMAGRTRPAWYWVNDDGCRDYHVYYEGGGLQQNFSGACF